MRTRSRHPWPALPVALMLVLTMLPLAGRAVAQGNTSHPAHIHQGSCDNLGDVVVPLDNVGTAEAASLAGAESAIPVQISETAVDVSLDDILAGAHAINIHESDDNIQTYIACGDIGGAVRGGTLVIGLGQLNDSTYSGVAILQANDAGGTTVGVFLTEGLAGGVAAAPAPADAAVTEAPAADGAAAAEDAAATVPAETEAAPAEATQAEDAAAPAGETVQVSIQNFSFNPTPIEINAGDTIVWTNLDSVPHTVTGQNRDLLQSGTLQPGATFSQTFTEAGEIAYFCEFHPNMNGSIVVNP